MALATFAVGEYTSTYDSTTLGICTSGGKHLRYRKHGEPINDTDTYGRTTIDIVYLGFDCFLTMTFREWLAKVKIAIWQPSNAFDGILGVIGRLGSDYAKQIVLTAVAATPAATTGPATITFPKCVLAPGQDVDVMFAPWVRDIPITFQVLPSDVSGAVRFFTQT